MKIRRSGLAALISGATITQLVPLLFAPLIARLYAPDQFGVFAAFGAALALAATIGTGRYHLAIPLAQDDATARELVRLCTAIGLVVGLGAAVITLTCGALGVVPQDLLLSLLLAAPIAVALTAATEALTYWRIREKHEPSVARASLARTRTSQLSQVGLSAQLPDARGLIWGTVTGSFAGLLPLLGNVRLLPQRGDATRLRTVAQRYWRFPRYELPSHLAYTVTMQGLPLLIGAAYGAQQLGLYALALRVVNLPSMVIGVAVGQFCLREISEARDSDELPAFVRRVTVALAIIAAPTVMVLVSFGGPLFALVFGQNWATSGWLAAAMTPLLFARFCASPLTGLFHVYDKQRQLMGAQLVMLLGVGTTAAAVLVSGGSLLTLTWATSLATVPVYGWILFRAMRLAHERPKGKE